MKFDGLKMRCVIDIVSKQEYTIKINEVRKHWYTIYSKLNALCLYT